MEQPDDASTNTSNDDKTEDFGDNPTRDTLADGLLSLLRPTIEQLDDRVRSTRLAIKVDYVKFTGCYLLNG